MSNGKDDEEDELKSKIWARDTAWGGEGKREVVNGEEMIGKGKHEWRRRKEERKNAIASSGFTS